MGDEANPNGQGGQPADGGEGGGAGAGGGAPAGGAPPAGGGAPPAQPPRSAAPPQRPQGKGGGGNGKPTPFDQHPGFRKRLNQEVERTLRRELGVSVEEAKKIIARGGTSTEGATGGAPAGGTNTAAETQALKAAIEEQAARIVKLKKKLKRTRSAASAEMTALEMKTDAIAAGVPEKYVRFALDVYRDLWRQAAADPKSVAPAVAAAFDKDPVDSRAVFAFIKAEHMPTAGAAPPPPPEEVPLDPSTSPPPSRQPGGEAPKPKQPGGEPPPVFDANKLSDVEWRRQKRSMGIGG